MPYQRSPEQVYRHRSEAFGDRDRRVVCRTCHIVMNDSETCQQEGSFYHPTSFSDGQPNKCKNTGKNFGIGDKEVDLYVRKRDRRAAKRATGKTTIRG